MPERQHTHLSQQIPASQNNLTCFRLAPRFSNIPITFKSTWLECMFCNISDCFWGKDYTRPTSHRGTLSSVQFLNSGQVSMLAILLGRECLMPTQRCTAQKTNKSPESPSGKELKCPHLEERKEKLKVESGLREGSSEGEELSSNV